MTKKILALAFAVSAFAFGMFCACSQDKTNAIEYTLSDDGTYYTVTGAANVQGEVIIESTYNDLPVTQIGNRAFYNCENMTNVTIPDCVTYIGYYAFYGCTSLASVTIPDGVTYIGSSAFAYCSTLTQLVIPDGVTYIGKRILA